MSFFHHIASGLRSLLQRKRVEGELDEELRGFLEMAAEEKMKQGMSRSEALRSVRLERGNLDGSKDEIFSARWESFLATVYQDLRFGLRQLRKNPGFTVVAILTMAFSIGVNTAIFSVVNAVLLRPLPYKNAENLVSLRSQNRARGFDTDLVSSQDFVDWRSQSRSFESMAASTDVTYTLTGAGEPELLIAYAFSPDFFDVLGVPPHIGRTFSAEEQLPGKNHVAVLSYSLWQSRFGADASLLNKTIHLDGEPYTVVGIMPAGFEYPSGTQLWTPLTIPAEAANDRAYRYLRVMARLKPDATIQQARTEMNTIAQRLATAYPGTNKEEDAVNLIKLRESVSGDIRPALLVLMCAVGFVLLIACANLANLLLARAVAREKEVVVRGALGATRARLVRQFLTESAVVAAAGGATGLLLAWLFTNRLLVMFPQTIFNLNLPKLHTIPMDGWVLGFVVALSILSVVVFGLVPALQAGRQTSDESFKGSARSATGGPQSKRLRASLIVVELALSLILLTAAGLTLKSFVNLLRGEIGFRSESVLTLRVLFPQQKYKTPAQRAAFSDDVLGRIKSLPGVKAVGTVTFLPLSGWYGLRAVSLENEIDPESHKRSAVWSSVTPDYFRAMDISLLAGRFFSDNDRSGSAQVAIVSRSLAKQLAPSGDVVGARIHVEGVQGVLEVAGIVGDVHQLGLLSELTSEIYLPFAQVPTPILCFAIKTEPNPGTLAKTAEREIWAVDKDQSISFVMPLTLLESDSLAPQRVVTMLLGFFAGAALLMAAIGIYGVISYSAGQRTQEIGIRMALGARRLDILAMTLYEGLRLMALGMALGLTVAFLLTRFLSTILYGVKTTDPFTFIFVSILLSAVAIVACFIPARRAAKLDPMVALRYE